MSDNSAQDKTERPSEHRLRKAQEEGNLPRSKELVTALMMIASALLLSAFSDGLAHMVDDIFHYSLAPDKANAFDPARMIDILVHCRDALFETLMPMLGMLALVTVAGNLVRGGWNLSLKAAMPNFGKMNPITGIGRLFSVKSLAELVKSILKVALVAGALYWLLTHNRQRILELQQQPIREAIPETLDLLWSGLFVYGLALLLIAVLELPYSSWDYLRQLKMTKQEVKEEMKNNEGKPEVKARIRQLQRQMSQRQIRKTVPQADVIITNPTHYAVALKYDLSKATAPFVIAKGVDQMALQIRQIAHQHNLPVVEVPPLARAVYYSTNEWQEIPAQLYIAVAHVLTYIFQMEQYRQGRQSTKPAFPEVDIPSELRR